MENQRLVEMVVIQYLVQSHLLAVAVGVVMVHRELLDALAGQAVAVDFLTVFLQQPQVARHLHQLRVLLVELAVEVRPMVAQMVVAVGLEQ